MIYRGYLVKTPYLHDFVSYLCNVICEDYETLKFGHYFNGYETTGVHWKLILVEHFNLRVNFEGSGNG